MKKWQIAISILLVFAIGTAAGAFGSRVIFKKRISRVLHSESASGIRVIQRMIGRLDLSEAQRTSINKILDENNKKWETILQEYGPEIKTLYETTTEEIKNELTKQQQKEFEQMSVNVQRRLPPRTFSPPRSSKQPRSSIPPEESSPPGMSEPFGPKPESDYSTDIVQELQLDDKKIIDEVQAIIQEGLVKQQSLRDEFGKSQAAAEKKFQEKITNAQAATKKKLEKLLTPDQLETYGRMMSPEEPRPENFGDDFGFDGHGEAMEPKDFNQGEFPTHPDEQQGTPQDPRSI